ncbi:hypothetical protein ACWDUD_10490 [Rhodococcus sp. NPDC003382]
MSWDEYHRKTAVLDAVLDRAAETGQTTLPYVDVPEASSVFASESDLVSALEAKWAVLYRGFLEQEAFAGESTGASPAEIARSAWERVDDAEPALRRLIDHNSPHGGPTLARAAEDVPIEASGGVGGSLRPWSANVGGVAGPSGVAAEVGALLILLMFAFVLWSLY